MYSTATSCFQCAHVLMCYSKRVTRTYSINVMLSCVRSALAWHSRCFYGMKRSKHFVVIAQEDDEIPEPFNDVAEVQNADGVPLPLESLDEDADEASQLVSFRFGHEGRKHLLVDWPGVTKKRMRTRIRTSTMCTALLTMCTPRLGALCAVWGSSINYFTRSIFGRP